MAKIWVTRSEPGASVLADALNTAGYAVWQAPVVEVQPLNPWRVFVNEIEVAGQTQGTVPPAWLEPAPNLVVALSAHAVDAFINTGLQHYAETASFISIGKQTAAALKGLGIDAKVPEMNTSEGLLQMPEITQIKQRDTVWILAGVAGRELLLRELRDVARCRVVKFELYNRQIIDVGAVDVDGIAALIVSSELGLVASTQQWRAAGGDLDIVLIAPSGRVADKAAELGFTNVHTADTATASAVLAQLGQVAQLAL